jgi:hypothetical protein
MTRQFAKRLVLVAAGFAAATGYACACPPGDFQVASINCTPTVATQSPRTLALSCQVTLVKGQTSTVHDTIPDPGQ